MVFGRCCLGSVQAFTTSRTKRLYLSTKLVSTTLHSKLAKHSAMRGGATDSAGRGVSPNFLNLSTARPDEFHGGNRNDALVLSHQCRKTVVVAAHDAGYQRRHELDHREPGHCHDIGSAFLGRGEQNDRTGFEELIDL